MGGTATTTGGGFGGAPRLFRSPDSFSDPRTQAPAQQTGAVPQALTQPFNIQPNPASFGELPTTLESPTPSLATLINQPAPQSPAPQPSTPSVPGLESTSNVIGGPFGNNFMGLLVRLSRLARTPGFGSSPAPTGGKSVT